MNTWWLVAIAVIVVLTSILVFRVHAFLTLLLAGLLVAALTSGDSLARYTDSQVKIDRMSESDAKAIVGSSAPTRLATAFGESAGKIGILIALASIIGQCLLESGGARTIVDRMLAVTGPRRAPEAMAASSFVLGIPVFFDTVFYLMIPLARSLRKTLGKDYVLFILSILAGGSLAHSLVPPTPGPLLVADIFKVDLATMMLTGLVIGGCSSVVALLSARIINRIVEVPLREDGETVDGDDLAEMDADPAASDRLSPPLLAALLPIVTPVVLIAIGSIVKYWVGQLDGGEQSKPVYADLLLALGNKNVALAIGVAFALSLFKYCPEEKRRTLVTRSLAAAGNIILITAAGGAFGAMLRQAGIGQAVSGLVQDVPAVWILPIAFAVTAAIRTLQGSATVAMITAAGILQGIASPESLPFHPVYLAMAIGAGSKPVSWMTDSAFWVIIRMSGMTESEGLKVISPMSIAMGVGALVFTMIFATAFPTLGG